MPTTESDTASQTPDATSNNGNIYFRNQRRRGGIGAQNRNLAQMESSVKEFKGKIDSLPTLGKPHEVNASMYDKFTKDLVNYVQIKFKRGEDMEPLIDRLDDTEAILGTEHTLNTGAQEDEIAKFKIKYPIIFKQDLF